MDEGAKPYIIFIVALVILVLILAIAVLYLVRILREGKDANSKVQASLFGNDEVTEEEIISMVNEGQKSGVIQDSEFEMIHNIFEFDEKDVKDIMTHRSNMIGLDGELSFIDAVSEIVLNGKSRFPVYIGDTDHIIGVLHIKDAFSFFQKNEYYRTSIKDIPGLVREVEFVPETVSISDLFKKMQSQKSHMVIVVDEYGQVGGLVALEDILEEIVGNIEDEHDEEEETIHKETDGTYYMDGLTSFADMLETLKLPLEDGEYETLNGFLVNLLEKIPGEDGRPKINAYGYCFEVESVENNIIGRVKISRANSCTEN